MASFATGTEVLTPEGRVAIETLREGDLVIARDVETGQTGTFPVTALMLRTSHEVIWLTLEDSVGETTQMGVTSEHPLFVAGRGWVTAGDVSAGDTVRDGALQALTVLSVVAKQQPTKVHNFEVADAHTYFVGDLGAWTQNGTGAYVIKLTTGTYVGKGCSGRMMKSLGDKLKEYGGDGISLALDSQGSLRRFPLSQFHQFFPEGFRWRSPSQTFSGCAV